MLFFSPTAQVVESPNRDAERPDHSRAVCIETRTRCIPTNGLRYSTLALVLMLLRRLAPEQRSRKSVVVT